MTDEAMSPLRRRMIEDMTIRKLSPKTQQGYIRTIKDFAVFLGRSPDTAGFEDIRRFQLYLAVVPFAAGGRIVGERMRASLGQTVIVENITGAAGSIAVGRVARAAPDGYTIGIGHWGTHVVNGATYALQYDLLTDLTPVALLASTPSLIVSKSAMPAKDLKELVAWLKANPDKASQGSGGAGSAAHIHLRSGR